MFSQTSHVWRQSNRADNFQDLAVEEAGTGAWKSVGGPVGTQLPTLALFMLDPTIFFIMLSAFFPPYYALAHFRLQLL